MLRGVDPLMKELSPGTIVGGDFQVERLLSAGGMGAVYVARQLSTGSERALKIMHPSFVADPAMRERFSREARVGAMVPSDHVVQVVGAGVDPVLGVPWLAMELLAGENLAQYVARRGALPPHELVEILRPVCHALAAAHGRGIVHRDIKPENVFLATTQSTSHPMMVKVLDFGIARVSAGAETSSTAAMGTPMWMAPEQTELRSQVSPASDVWALGLLAFWLATGKVYWRAGNAGGASVPQLMREVLFEPLVPASARALELGVPVALPPGFDAWFARAVARDPAARFPSAAEAASALLGEVLGASALPSFAPPPAPSAPSVASSPVSATAVPTTVAAPPSRPKKQGALGLVLLAMAGLLAVFGALAAGAAYLYFRDGDELVPASSSGSPVAPLPPSASALVAEPAPSAPAPVAKNPRPHGATTATGSDAGASKPVPSASAAEPELPPYNASAAQSAVQTKATWAGTACKSHPGPAAIGGTVTIQPNGFAGKVLVAPKDLGNSRATCAISIMYGVKTSPYAGKETHDLPFTVVF